MRRNSTNEVCGVLVFAFVFAVFSGCSGGGGGGGVDKIDPVVCTAPFVPSSSGTLCVCPAGTHDENQTCVPDGTADTTPPTVTLVSPTNGSTVSGTVDVVATVVDASTIAMVSLYLDDNNRSESFTFGPAGTYTAQLNTTALTGGSHTVKVCATDSHANIGCSAVVSVTVNNTGPDTTPPAVTITSPANGATASGTFALKAAVTDDRGLASLQLLLDGTQTSALISEGPTGVFTFSVDSTGLANGNHSLRVCASDAASNTSCTGATTVTLSNAPLLYSWKPVSSLTTDDIRVIWGSGPNDVWIGGTFFPGSASCGIVSNCYSFQHWNGSTLSYVGTETYSYVYSMWGTGPSDIWASAYHGMLHWNGSAWSLQGGSPSGHALFDMWGTGRDDIWAVGEYGMVAHWNGSAWTESEIAADQNLTAVWGTPGDVWIFGASVPYRWNGATLSPTTTDRVHPYAAWGTGPNDLWAAGWSGIGGTVWHWDGEAWSVAINLGGANLLAIWGTSPDDIWVAGSLGRIVHWDGTGWSNVPSGASSALRGLWGSGTDVWAVGDGGTIVRYGP